MASKLFTYNRSLPKPFDKVSKKIISASSMYGDGTAGRMTRTVMSAVMSYFGCKEGTKPGAVGLIDHRSVAEYKSSKDDEYHLVVYDSGNGGLMASCYDTSTEMGEQYTVGNKAKDGAAIVFALMPFLLKDVEFEENMDKAFKMHQDGYPDLDEAIEVMALLCDNVYRRINDDACPAHVKVNIDKTGNILLLRRAQLEAGTLEPNNVLAGEFTIFSKSGAVPNYAPAVVVPHTDLVGKYRLNPSRIFTDREERLIPALPDWYITPREVLSICTHALKTSGKATPMRNFLLRGPAGTGKTWDAKAIAAAAGLPYMKITCGAGMETADFVGQVFPEVTAADIAELRDEKKILDIAGGHTDENIIVMMKLPGDLDLKYDPEESFLQLTGIRKEGATTEECIQARLNLINHKKAQLQHLETLAENVGQKFTYIETDFVKALRRGYLVEIQEPTCILQPGVLVGLNSLLEQEGGITLPTGEVIQRHPEALVIITTNTDYEGCRTLNQSVTDRMNLVLDIELPAPEVMAERAMAVTKCDDDALVSQMVQVVNDISSYCRDNGITDGSCGMRSLIDWINSTEITGDAYDSALKTVISKATSDAQDRGTLVSAILEPIFPPRRRAA